jgi:hypothetical protein
VVPDPGTHRVLAFIYHKLVRANEKSLEQNWRICCCPASCPVGTVLNRSLTSFFMLTMSMKYEHIGRKSRLQQLVKKDGCSFDVQICDDSNPVWFDTTAPRDRLAQIMRTEK